MLGIVVFQLLIFALVAVNSFTDHGMTERRRIRPGYGSLLVSMAEFEKSGGRVQEIDKQARTTRRMMLKLIVLPWVFALMVTLVLTWLGASLWIPATIIALYVVAVGTLRWLVSDLFGLVDETGPRSKSTIAVALVAVGLKGIIVAAGVLTAARGINQLNDGDWITGLGLQVIAIALLTYCYLPVYYADRHMQKLKEVDFAHTAKTDSVLFLRSFSDDSFRLYSPYGSLGPRYRFIPGRKRFEELISSSILGKSDFVGVGRPGESRPMLGASRTYWDHDSWKDAIKSTAARAEGLLVLAGRTPSLRWEMTQISELGLLGKSLILFPPDQHAGTVERYTFIDDALAFPPEHRLPDELKVTLTAIGFDAAGQPVHYTSGGRDWASYVATILHFQMVLDGEIRFEAVGAVSEAYSMADDSYNQAAFLLDNGNRAEAEAILSSATVEVADSATHIGRAWAQVAFHSDFAGARELILSSPVAGNEAMVQRAIAALDGTENSGNDCRDILRARYPERFQNQPSRVR